VLATYGPTTTRSVWRTAFGGTLVRLVIPIAALTEIPGRRTPASVVTQ
jgi:hypothetical protein